MFEDLSKEAKELLYKYRDSDMSGHKLTVSRSADPTGVLSKELYDKGYINAQIEYRGRDKELFVDIDYSDTNVLTDYAMKLFNLNLPKNK